MPDSDSFKPATLDLATGKISYLVGGEGPTLICLHHSWGSPGALELHQLLAEDFTVYIPDMPGWGGSERPLWARTVRDVAILMAQFGQRVSDGTYNLLGFGFGGYVAAEIASMSAQALDRLILVGAVGLQPRDDEIMDQMMYSHRQYIEESFRDRDSYIEHMGEEPPQELRELWDHSREMTARVSWKPYMFNQRLGHLLQNVDTPTLLINAEKDKVTPGDIAKQYQSALKNSQSVSIADAGHLVEIEQPSTVQELVKTHCLGG